MVDLTLEELALRTYREDAKLLTIISQFSTENIDVVVEPILQARMAQRKYRDAAGLIVQTLEIIGSNNSEYALHFILDLAYILSIDSEAQRCISPDNVLHTIEDAVAFLEDTCPQDVERIANAFCSLGSVHLQCREGDLAAHAARSRACYDRAIELFAIAGEEYEGRIGHIFLHRSKLFRTRTSGDPAKNIDLALHDARSAVAIFERIADGPGLARAYNICGTAMINRLSGSRLSNWYSALQYHTRATKLWQQAGMWNEEAEELVHLGVAEIEVGSILDDLPHLDRGVANLEKAYEAIKRLELRHLVAFAMLELLIARATLFSSRPPSLELIEESILMGADLARRAMTEPDSYETARVHCVMAGLVGAAAVARRDEPLRERAVSHRDAAINCFERLSRGPTSNASRQIAHLEFRMGVLSREFSLHLQAESYFANAEEAARAWMENALSLTASDGMSQELYLAAVARSHLQALRGALLDSVATLDQVLGVSLELIKSDEANIMSLRIERNALLAALDGSQPTTEQDIDQNVERLQEIKRLISDQRRSQSSGPEDIISDLVEAIPENGAVLLPLFGEQGDIFICAHRADGGSAPHLTKIDCPNLASKVNSFAAELTRCSEAEPEDSAEALAVVLASLGEILKDTVVSSLKAISLEAQPELIVVTHGLSASVPWHAAHWNDHNGLKFLGDEFLVSTAPSIRWLAGKRREARLPRGGETTVGVLADPRNDLAGARLEASLVLSNIRGRQLISLSGPDATTDRALSVLHGCQYVHLAMHSDFSWDLPFHSALKLANGTIEIAQLVASHSQAPETIVLSSCSSGASNLHQLTGERWGFSWALHRWGVRSILASLWDGFDVAMVLLFSEYYRHPNWFGEPLVALTQARIFVRTITAANARERVVTLSGTPDALRKILLEVDSCEEKFGASAPFAHPLFWAPLTFSGLHNSHATGQ
ncbi:CHAT domain-containing protein [Rhizobium ruizarguesonis]